VNISSVGPIVCLRNVAIYTGTKGYLTAFSRSLAEELKNKIDVLVVAPGYVVTPMTTGINNDFFTVKTEDCVKGALKELGRGEFTYGAWRHTL
jgi:short-subunit dehydrogenase